MSEFTTVPDCLVFKFEEIEIDTGNKDMTVYVFYDKKTHRYVIRGRRAVTRTYDSCTYSFECDYAHELADFLQYVICSKNTVNEVLYNFDNLADDSNDVTFEFLNECDHFDYEISGYNKQKLKRKSLLKNLRMLRNVFNYYN